MDRTHTDGWAVMLSTEPIQLFCAGSNINIAAISKTRLEEESHVENNQVGCTIFLWSGGNKTGRLKDGQRSAQTNHIAKSQLMRMCFLFLAEDMSTNENPAEGYISHTTPVDTFSIPNI